MIKDDEVQFLELIQKEHSLEDAILCYEKRSIKSMYDSLGMHPKRAWYILTKWTQKGWFDYGVSPYYGWLTKEGRTVVLKREKAKVRVMNDWYKKGELPPVGESVRYYCPKDLIHKVVEVVAHRGSAAVVVDEDDNADVIHIEHLKPIYQEREDFINTFLRDSDISPSHTHHNLVRSILRNVHDAGYRKVKPLSFAAFNQMYRQCDRSENLYHMIKSHIVNEG